MSELTTIKKPQSLEKQLLAIKESKYLFIPFRAYTEMHVRKVVRKLNREGYSYKASTAEVIDGIRVTRLK